MTMTQIVLVNEFVWDHRATILTELISPIAQMVGGKYKAPQLKPKSKQPKDRDQALLDAAADCGLSIK